MTDLYHEIILDEYKNPSNKGELKGADLVVEGSNASCGDDVKIFINLKNGTIKDILWQGEGCAISQAAMSLLSQEIKDKRLKLKEIKQLKLTDMLELLGLEEISPGRIKCSLLGLDTIKKGLK